MNENDLTIHETYLQLPSTNSARKASNLSPSSPESNYAIEKRERAATSSPYSFNELHDKSDHPDNLLSPKSVSSTIRLDAPAYEPTANSSAKSENDSQ
jgi:hypothetical protein